MLTGVLQCVKASDRDPLCGEAAGSKQQAPIRAGAYSLAHGGLNGTV